MFLKDTVKESMKKTKAQEIFSFTCMVVLVLKDEIQGTEYCNSYFSFIICQKYFDVDTKK